MRDDRAHEDRVRDRRHQHHDAVDRGRDLVEVVLAHPSRHERRQRQPEEQMQVRPQDRAVDPVDHVQHVVMVVPVDADEDEAHQVGQKHGHQRLQRVPPGSVRHFQLEDHDRDDDRDHAVAECFKARFAHICQSTVARAPSLLFSTSLFAEKAVDLDRARMLNRAIHPWGSRCGRSDEDVAPGPRPVGAALITRSRNLALRGGGRCNGPSVGWLFAAILLAVNTIRARATRHVRDWREDHRRAGCGPARRRHRRHQRRDRHLPRGHEQRRRHVSCHPDRAGPLQDRRAAVGLPDAWSAAA